MLVAPGSQGQLWWVAHIAEDSYAKEAARSEATMKGLEEEMSRLQAEAITMNDQVCRLIGQVRELDGRLKRR